MHEWNKPLIDWNRTVGTPNPTTVAGSTSPRIMDTQHYYPGIQPSNYYYKNYVTSYSFGYKTISVCSNNNPSYGLGLPVEVTPGATYRLSATATSNKLTGFGYYDSDWNYVSRVTESAKMPNTVTIPSGVKYAVIWFGSNQQNIDAVFTDIEFDKV